MNFEKLRLKLNIVNDILRYVLYFNTADDTDHTDDTIL